jgi:O-antigen ligase
MPAVRLASPQRLPPAEPARLAVAAGAVLVTLVVTLAMAYDPRAAAVLVAMLVFTVVALVSLPWGVALWVQLGFLAGGFPPLYLAMTAGSVLLVLAWSGELRRRRKAGVSVGGSRWPIVATVALAAYLLLTFAWADDPASAENRWVVWARALVVFVIIATTLTERRHLRLVAGAFVVGAVLSVLVGLAAGGLTPTTEATPGVAVESRLVGGAGDANILAAGLLPGFALAVVLFATTRGLLTRSALVIGMGVMVFGLVTSQSRGALVAAVVMLLIALAFARGQRMQIVMTAVAVAALAAAFFTAYPAAFDRITGFDEEGTGREELWSVAWAMAQDHPVLGVGLENFKVHAEEYVRRPGALKYVQLIAERPHVVHNTYLGMLAEAGIVGTMLLLYLFYRGVNAAYRAERAFRESGERELNTLSRGVLIGAIGILVASIFLSAGDDPRVWVLLGLGSALLALARRGDTPTAVGYPAR